MNTLHYIHLIALSEAVELIKKIDDAHIEDGKTPEMNPLTLCLQQMEQANLITDIFTLSDKRNFNEFCIKNQSLNNPLGDLCYDLMHDAEILNAPNSFLVLAKLLSLRKQKHLTHVVDNVIEQVFEQQSLLFHKEVF